MKLQMKTHNLPGYLFVFCGLDGSGKTTQIALLKDYLEKQGLPVHLTKQPTDAVRKSEIFRTYMDESDHTAYDYRALSLLCASDRVQHTNKEIVSRLSAGEIVISDRYFYSCLANLRARGYAKDHWIYEIASFLPKPDVSFFMDVDVDTAVARVRSRENEKNRYIDMPLQYRLREQYLEIARENDGVIIDNRMAVDKTFQMVQRSVMEITQKNPKPTINKTDGKGIVCFLQ